MASGFWTRLFGGGRADEEREDVSQEALAEGPPSFWDRFRSPFGGRDAWTREWRRRRDEVKRKYFADKQQIVMERRRAERELKEDLRRQFADIERYYRLHELSSKDPRRASARKKADEKMKRLQRRAWRHFRRQWHARLKALQRSRDHQYREITESMKETFKRAA